MIFRTAGITTGTCNGIGISLEIWFQGCEKRCPGCHNPELQFLEGGFLYDTDLVLEHLNKYKDFYNSIVYIGGEPLLQPKSIYSIANFSNLSNILYTGFNVREIPDYILNVMNIIVDGPYIQELRADFPNSSNQSIYVKNNSNIFIKTTNDFRKNLHENTNNI
jgi:anaerobic ribonucleoside-triphosphate reductase activating protein